MRTVVCVVLAASVLACGTKRGDAPGRDPALPPGLVLPKGKTTLANKQTHGDTTTLVYEYARPPAELLGELVTNLHAEGHQDAKLAGDTVTAHLGFAKKTIRATAIADDGTTRLTLVIAPARAPAGTNPGLDRTGWEPRALQTLGFALVGVIDVPAGTTTRTTTATSGGRASPLAYLELADGTRVMLTERAAAAPTDPAQLVGTLAATGTIVIDRREPTWFAVGVERPKGIALQAASWGVAPGLDCGTERPLTRAQVDVVTAICASLRAKP